MINIDFNKLNPLEQQIYNRLLESSKLYADLKITQAAELCNCSMSKISKAVKKLGFSNYKQFMDFLYGRDISQKEMSNELDRIKRFIDDFDEALVDEFIEMINGYEKIILFGYGPSFICAQYFEYRLRTCSSKFILAAGDEISVETMVDQNTLLVIFTTTGSFRSFEDIYRISKDKGCKVLIIAEEYNTTLMTNCDRFFWLCKYPQPADLKPHEKSRTVFIIFIEEIINKLMTAAKTIQQEPFHQ
jgi:DNA-binding MurR/RpiR family transcriptional regulator